MDLNHRHFVYILRCVDDTLYTGYTVDPKRRLAEHNSGKAAKYTRPRRPVELVYLEEVKDRSEGLKREYAIKQLRRSDKLRLIEQGGEYREKIQRKKPRRG